MTFDSSHYGGPVSSLLALDGDGHRLMPLAGGDCSSTEAQQQLKTQAAAILFPNSPAPQAALAGLWLYFSCRDEAHKIAQDLSSAEGSFWHGILHRQEPDPANAAYWFRQAGLHPVFPALRDAALKIQRRYASAKELSLQKTWDPFAFIAYCEDARRSPGCAEEAYAIEVQLAEWQLLFDHCARPRK
jgi:hypothetical protein